MSWFSTVRSASKENWHKSIRQVISIATISLIPLALKAAYYYFDFIDTDDEITFLTAILNYVISGELLFFSIANFAAVLWLSSQDFKDHFEERIYFVILSVIGMCICTFFIGIDPNLKGIPIEVIRAVSIITFLISLIANTVLLVFESYSGVDFSSKMSKDENDTAARLAARRGE